MKTLKTLLAVTLLASTVAPSFAMQDHFAAHLDGEQQGNTPAEAVVAEKGLLAQAGTWFTNHMTAEYLKNEEGVRQFGKETLLNNKANLGKTAGLYAAILAAATGLGYGAYKLFFAGEDEVTADETPVTTTSVVDLEKDLQPVKPSKPAKPVKAQPVKKAGKARFGAPRGGRFGKKSSSRVKSARVSSCSKKHKSCKSCK